RESDPHDALDLYGKSKSLGEPSKKSLVLRTSIIGTEKENYYSLISWVLKQDGKKINGFINHFWNGITTLQYAKIVEKIILENLYKPGLRHIFSPEIVNKFLLIKYISEVFNVKAKINPYYDNITIARHLSSDYDFVNYFNIPKIEEQLIELKKFVSVNGRRY
ncbi:MAG: NAD-dependent dehydratase, partial [Candidatus Hodarchaeota archaeon]